MKAIKTSEKAAYKVVPGLTAEQAAEKGYVVVETNGDGTAPLFGYYIDTVTGAALETLQDRDDRVPVAASGERVGAVPMGNKGALLNPDDPVVHGQGDHNPHEDGAAPSDSQNKDLKLDGYSPGDDLKAGKKK